MSANSKIEWTDSTWNPIRARNKEPGKVGWYCEHATTGCEFCYAESMNKRLGTGLPFKPGHRNDVEIFLDDKMLTLPLCWKKPRMIFVCSMSDVFADFVTDEAIDKIFAVMALSPQHTFQVLTKRAKRMRDYMTATVKGPWAGRAWRIDDEGTKHEEWDVAWRLRTVISDMLRTVPADSLNRACAFMDKRDGGEGDGFFRRWPLPNVWLGVSTERQQEADERIPLLLQTPAAVRFISAEPLLGPISLTNHEPHGDANGWSSIWKDNCIGRAWLDWVIVGGESGPGARPMHPDWARSLRDQCAAASVPFFFKQWGEWKPHKVAPGGDLGGAVRAGTVRIVHPTGQSDVEVFESTKGHNTIPGSRYMVRVGKKAAGRLLDGIEHNGMPT